jgi:hypothetical protein
VPPPPPHLPDLRPHVRRAFALARVPGRVGFVMARAALSAAGNALAHEVRTAVGEGTPSPRGAPVGSPVPGSLLDDGPL